MDFSSGSPPPLPLGHVQEQLGDLIPTLCVHPDVSRTPRLLFPRPPSLGLPHAGDHLELLSQSWECSPSSKGAGRIPFPFSDISWMCPSMTHSVFQPLAPSLGMRSCHRSLSHEENLEFLPWTWSFWVFHAPLDAASPAGMAPAGMGTGLESVWGDF